MDPEDFPNDEVVYMDPEDISNDELVHMDSESISDNDFEAVFAVVVPLLRNELTRDTKSIQSGRGPATAVKKLNANTIVADNNMTEATPVRSNRARHIRSVQPNEVDTGEPVNPMPENSAPVSRSPAPTPEPERKQKKHGKKIRKASKTRHSSSESTKGQEDMEDAQYGSSIRPRGDGVTIKLERKQKNHGKKIRKASKPRHSSREPTRGEEDMEDAQYGSAIRPREDDATTLRRGRPASKTRISNRSAAQENHIVLEQPQDGSLYLNIANDTQALIAIRHKAFSEFSTSFYRSCKPFLVGYVIWLIITYVWVSTHRFATTALAPLCSTPVVGSRIPFCTELLRPSNRHINVSQATTSQEELVVVMDRLGQNFDLARDMKDHWFALQDLSLLVKLRDLSRKEELMGQLEPLIHYTGQTAKSLAQFTAKTGKSLDMIHIFDNDAVKVLNRIAERQRKLSALPRQILLAISPFAAFGPANAGYTEAQVKKIFITTLSQIIDEVRSLIKSSVDLDHQFDEIQSNLDQINKLAVNEIGNLPRWDVLSELWARLAYANEYEEYKSHQSLLSDLAWFYENSSRMIKETMIALNRIEAELNESGREYFGKPRLILSDHPLESIIALFRKAGQRLEAKHREFRRTKDRGRPQTKFETRKTVTRGVTLMTTRTQA